MKNLSKIKLSKFSSGAGWACKIGAKDLTQVLSKLKGPDSKNNSGFEQFDDCAIYEIDNNQSIIQTVDFFTPIVDDPYLFGKIAANNSLSDIYAMGGTPLFALNIVAFPTEELPLEILSDILRGGEDVCSEANINILGGHSIKDNTPKYGMAVTGIINNDKIIKNSTAKNNDVLILTKPLGSGIITTAIKKEVATREIKNNAIELMLTTNKYASKAMQKSKINACTDITGYGLLGHLNEMCVSSNLSAKINFDFINFIDGVEDLAQNGIIPGGTKNNFNFNKKDIKFDKNIKEYQKFMLADAQTAGGLLISTPNERSSQLLKELNKNSKYDSKIIGSFIAKSDKNIFVK